MVCEISRQGRRLQRYTSSGGRLVVGCIPYKLKTDQKLCEENTNQCMEVLVITSQKGHGMMFPKGGWELDETIKEAVSREAIEEAGVQGKVEERLGEWKYKSRRYGIFYEGIMFPLNVKEELGHWPEMGVRGRKWVTVAEAMEGCQHWWMREALDELVRRISRSSNQETNDHFGV